MISTCPECKSDNTRTEKHVAGSVAYQACRSCGHGYYVSQEVKSRPRLAIQARPRASAQVTIGGEVSAVFFAKSQAAADSAAAIFVEALKERTGGK